MENGSLIKSKDRKGKTIIHIINRKRKRDRLRKRIKFFL